MFGVGLPEMAVIALVAIFVFGPDRIPDLARQAGRFARRAKEMATTARDELRSELGPQYADLELRDLDPRAFVKKQIREAMAEIEAEEAAKESAGSAMATLAEGEEPPYDSDAT
ncbi:MAG: sec-independent translocase [Nocardioides sp.]